jgi:hypothetical protein
MIALLMASPTHEIVLSREKALMLLGVPNDKKVRYSFGVAEILAGELKRGF